MPVINPKVAFFLEQLAVSLSKWFLRVALPTLGATMLGALVYLLLILGLGLTLTGCRHAPEPPPPTTVEGPRVDDDCLGLVHASCSRYSMCREQPDPLAAYVECQTFFQQSVFKGQFCLVEPGQGFTGPVDQCTDTLLDCRATDVEVELVCGAVQVSPATQ